MTVPSAPQANDNRPSIADLGKSYGDHSKALEALADAQEEIGDLKDARREERVGWIVVCVILFDVAFLLNAENWAGPIIIGVLQISVVAIIAKRMGVEEFYALFASVMNRFGGMLDKGE